MSAKNLPHRVKRPLNEAKCPESGQNLLGEMSKGQYIQLPFGLGITASSPQHSAIYHYIVQTIYRLRGVRFNPSKCNIMRIHRSKPASSQHYDLCGVLHQEVDHTKYFGVTISSNLEWRNHVDVTAKKAANALNFRQRNLKYCPKQVKQTAYFSLVRFVMKYSGAIWDTEGEGQARESVNVQQDSWQTTPQPRDCNTQELGLVILRTPSTKPTSDLDV